MKQTLFMIALTAVGVVGVITHGPFVAVWAYYLFAVLRPQYMWQWALPTGISWSEYVAVAAVVGALGHSIGVFPLGRTSRDRFRGLSTIHWLFVMFGGWVCLSYVTASNRAVAWPWLLEYLKIFLMFIVAATVIRTRGQAWTIYLTATIALIYIGYEVNFLYLVNGRLNIYHGGYGGLDNNGAGLMLAMGIPLSLYAWEGTARIWRWGFAAAIPVLLHAVLMTYSRGAMVALLLVAPLLALRTKRRWQFLVIGTGLAMLIPMLAGAEIRARFFSTSTYEEDASAASRFASWNAAIDMANDNPVFGVGLRNAGLFSYDYGADRRGRTIHSQYLQLLADTGYPGLVMYLAVVATFFLGVRRVRRSLRGKIGPEATQIRSMANGLEGAMAVFCAGSAFLSLEVFELPYLLILLGAQMRVLMKAEALAHQVATAKPRYPLVPSQILPSGR
jgi:probable O-glycosylation ligase (exosortase A-associated)